MKNTMRGAAILLPLLAAGAIGSAHAGCTVSSTGVAFGAYQPLNFPGKLTSVDKTSTGSVSVVCSGVVTGGSYSISLGPSLAGNSIATRYMANPAGGPNLAFNIYQDLPHTVVWGDGVTGGLLSGTIPTGASNQQHPVYGKLPGSQNTVNAGAFSATMTMTLTYNP